MANAVSLPLKGSTLKLIPTSEPRAAFVFNEDKSAPKVPQTNSKGQPLFAFNAVAQLGNTDLGAVRVLSPAETLPASGFGTVLVGSGEGELKISNVRDGFDLRVSATLDGVEVAGAAPRRSE